jgi:hypothetical protein
MPTGTFSIKERLDQLQLDGLVKVSRVPALFSGRERPSDCVALHVRTERLPIPILSSDSFVPVQLLDVAIFSAYMPTDYHNLNSEQKFGIVCSKLANTVVESQKQGLTAIVAGDMNGNLNDTKSSRKEILLGFCPQLSVMNKDLVFTYVYNSGCASNFGCTSN